MLVTKMHISRHLISDLPTRQQLIDAAKKDLGKNPKTTFFTIEAEDWEKNQCTLYNMDEVVNSLMITAPIDNLQEAITIVVKGNAHLKFDTNPPQVGYNNDDFVKNIVSARLKFEKI